VGIEPAHMTILDKINMILIFIELTRQEIQIEVLSMFHPSCISSVSPKNLQKSLHWWWVWKLWKVDCRFPSPNKFVSSILAGRRVSNRGIN